MRRLIVVLLLLLAVRVEAQAVSASYTAVHNAFRVSWSIPGMPDATDCTLTLKDLAGSTVGSPIVSTSGGGRTTRTEYFTSLTAGTNYKLTIDCGAPYEIIDGQSIATLPTPPAPAAITVPFQISSPGTFMDATRARVAYGTTTGLGTTLQNTNCLNGCLIAPSMTYGFENYAIEMQNDSDVVVGRTRTQGFIVGNSISATLTSSAPIVGGDEPEIPRLAQWESNMTYYGQITCNNFAAGGVNFGTYYDGLEAMERIAAYRTAKGDGDVSSWHTCSDTANSVYRTYVLANNGAVPGYNAFTTGFKEHYARTSEANSRLAAIYLAGYHLIDGVGHGAAYCGNPSNGTDYLNTHQILTRERTYCLRATLDAEVLGATMNPTNKPLTQKDILIGMIASRIGTAADPVTAVVLPSEEIADTGGGGNQCGGAGNVNGYNHYVQPFQLGMAARELLHYADQKSDDKAAILVVVKHVLDWLWANAYVASAKAFWYQNCRVFNGGAGTWPDNGSAADLNLMFADLYERMYRENCDTTYRDKADILFDEGVRLGSTSLGFDGKHFNQQYTFSFDYVAMRQLASPTCQ